MMFASAPPVMRPSRPRTILPPRAYCAKAAAYLTATSGVRDSPTIPRTPDMLTINDIVVVPIDMDNVHEPAELSIPYSPHSRRGATDHDRFRASLS